MKCIKHDFGSDVQQIRIIIFSDVHIGSPKCDYNLLHEYLDKVKNEPNTYCVLLGDIVNNTTKTSVGDIYDEPLSPMEQMKQAIMYFEPIKDKVLAITAGNHERRTYKNDGTDLTWLLAKQLGLEDAYDYNACLLFLRFGKMGHTCGGNGHTGKVLYTIYLTHGDGQGGRTVGGRMNGLQRRGNIVVDADVVITGHTHQIATFKEAYLRVDKNNSAVKQCEKTFVNSGSFLNYESYAELYGLPPTVKGSPEIILSGTKKKNVLVHL